MKLKNADKVFAMKILNKWEMLKRAEVRFIKYIFMALLRYCWSISFIERKYKKIKRKMEFIA